MSITEDLHNQSVKAYDRMYKQGNRKCIVQPFEINGEICEVSCEIDDIGECGQTGTRLYLQKCIFQYDSGIEELGYRVIRKLPSGDYNPYRGQDCIPTLAMARKLIDMMEEEFGIDEQAEWPEGRYSRDNTP